MHCRLCKSSKRVLLHYSAVKNILDHLMYRVGNSTMLGSIGVHLWSSISFLFVLKMATDARQAMHEPSPLL